MRTSPRAPSLVLSCWLACVSAVAVAPQAHAADARIAHVETWLKVIVNHEPGIDDAALREVGLWASDDVRTLAVDLNVLVQMIRNPGGVQFATTQQGQRRPTRVPDPSMQSRQMKVLACAAGGMVTQSSCAQIHAVESLDPDLQRLERLVENALRRGDRNYVIKRGALLHTDVAMLGLETSEAIVSGPTGGSQKIRLDTSDGQPIGLVRGADHWEVARMLLDFVQPANATRADPGHDDMVRLWYRATAAWMQSDEHHDRVHLDRARALFPNDPDILFLSACQHEVYAGTPIQNAVRAVALPTGFSLDVQAERAELREAEAQFRRALGLRPETGEARLRFGRVLGRLGRHAEAAIELRQAASAVSDPALQYYAQLFLGAEEEALGRFDAAHDAYARAAELGPVAQSPRIALSQLARRRGDRAGALKALQDVFALSADPVHDDYWWVYYVAQARNANDLLAELRKPFLKGSTE